MKVLIAGTLLFSSLSIAGTCGIKVPAYQPEMDAFDVMEEVLTEKGYTQDENGPYRLDVKDMIEHRGNQYVLTGFIVRITNVERTVIAEGKERTRLLRSSKRTLRNAAIKALDTLPACDSAL